MKKVTWKNFLSILLIGFLILTTIRVQNVIASLPTTQLILNGSQTGVINDSITDSMYSITVPTDGYLKVLAYPDESLSLRLTLFDIDGIKSIDSSYTFTKGQNMSLSAYLEAGTYFINVEQSSYPGGGGYELKNSFVPTTYTNDQGLNGTIKNAIPLNNGETKQGHLGYYSDGSQDMNDYYKITTTSEGKLNISVYPEQSLSLRLTLLDTDGIKSIDSDYTFTKGQNISLSDSLKPGTYFINVEQSSTPGGGGYEIKAGNSSVQRLFGNDRDTTAIAISKSGWPNSASTVVLARDDDFPDALAGAPLAHKYDAPILLTNPKVLSSDVANEINRLNPKKIYILGGYGAVSSDIELQLKSKGIDVIRLKGDSRFGTAAAIAQEVGSSSGKAVVTYGFNFPDALSVSSWAASNGVPILLSDNNQLPDETQNVLTQMNITQTFVIGGTGAIGNSVYNQLPSPQRLYGSDRYETNANVLQGLGMDMSNVFIATGENFPDALAGAALAARTDSPIFLVDQDSKFNYSQDLFFSSIINKIGNVYAFGGTGAVSDNFMKALTQ